MGMHCWRGARRMTTRQSGENSNGLDRAKSPSRLTIPAPRATTAKDRLDYIAAMLEELKIMSQQANCQPLAVLIGRAHREALRRARAD